MDAYGITSFGVSVTTLEEVFMKVGEGSEKTVDDLYVEHVIIQFEQFVRDFCLLLQLLGLHVINKGLMSFVEKLPTVN